MLHGEIVALGVLVQLKFNQMDQAYIDNVRALMQHMNLPTTLEKLGIEPSRKNCEVLIDYLIPATSLSEADKPRLEAALKEVL